MGLVTRRLPSAVVLSVIVSLVWLHAPDLRAEAPTPAVASQAERACVTDETSVSQVVRDVFKRLVSTHRRALPGPDGIRLRDQKLLALATRYVDNDRFTEAVVPGPWAQAPAPQRRRWARILGALLRDRLLRALKDPLGHTLEVGAIGLTCDHADIHLTLTNTQRSREVAVLLQLRRQDALWRIWDIASHDASFARTWRGRLARVVKQGGLAELDSQLSQLGARLGIGLADGVRGSGRK